MGYGFGWWRRCRRIDFRGGQGDDGGRRGRGSFDDDDERKEGGTDSGALRAGTRTNGPGGPPHRAAMPRSPSLVTKLFESVFVGPARSYLKAPAASAEKKQLVRLNCMRAPGTYAINVLCVLWTRRT
jgi:hypothetical protein